MEHNIIFKTISGSRAYGTNLSTSDTDYKGVYIQSQDDILGFNYNPQINITKDETYYEVKRFLELLQSANPNMLELLYMPDDCIIKTSEHFEIIKSYRQIFLTKKCLQSFGNYAIAQIRKARGLNKKINWEQKRVERKSVLDFCAVLSPDNNTNSVPLTEWLKKENHKQEFCGLVKLEHFKDCYSLFYDYLAEQASENPKFQGKARNYKGICTNPLTSNDVTVSHIEKYEIRETIMFFNRDAYSVHCKEYNSYQQWLHERNNTRYVETQQHQQRIDGKNLLHCRRLLDMAIEIATDNIITVRRPNADYLLKIRKGELELNEIINKAEEDIANLNTLLENSNLPDNCNQSFVNNLLLKLRKL